MEKRKAIVLKDLPDGKMRFNMELQLKELSVGEDGQEQLENILLMLAEAIDALNNRASYLDRTKKDRNINYY